MKINNILVLLLVVILFGSCEDDVLPKPKALLRLEYPKTSYVQKETENFSFRMNELSSFEKNKGNSFTIDYPTMKGSLFITYKEVEDNIEKLSVDAQRLSVEHSAKADGILPHPFVNEKDRVYGVYFEVVGDAASQAQFYATDSLNHFVTGSLYFYTRPNYDSIYPAASYLQEDIKKFMESIQWK